MPKMQELVQKDCNALSELLRTKDIAHYRQKTIRNALQVLIQTELVQSESIKQILLSQPRTSQEVLDTGLLDGMEDKSTIAFLCAQIGVCGIVKDVPGCTFPEIQIKQ